MKPPHFNEPPFGKKKKRNTQIYKKLAIIIALTLVIVIVIRFFHINKSSPKPSPSYFSSIKSAISNKNCDLFNGEWFPNPSAPYYTRSTCKEIQEHQNCMKYGRPDVGFMQWRWKPDGCDLPIFNPSHFLELMRDKSLAFVGDSLSRNHLQSLICLLTKVESPKDISSYRSEDGFKRYKYRSYNFILAIFWSPHLVKTKMVKTKKGSDSKDQTHLYLDEFDEKWTTQIDGFDYLIISGGHWFFSPKIFHENNHIVGCHNCLLENVTDLGYFYGYRKAFRTAFKAINNLKNFKGMTILRTFSPSHFENGEWNEGGNCVRKGPFFRNEIQMDGRNLELRKIQMEEFKAAEKEGKKRGLKYRVLDTTQAMLLRPDGHPSRYGHLPSENITMYNDCVHWCLPGPIDSLNDFLLEILKREVSFLTSV